MDLSIPGDHVSEMALVAKNVEDSLPHFVLALQELDVYQKRARR